MFHAKLVPYVGMADTGLAASESRARKSGLPMRLV